MARARRGTETKTVEPRAGSFVAMVIVLGAACTTEGGASGPRATMGTATPSCYLNDNGDCECVATNEDASRSGTEWKKVSACNESTVTGRLSCVADRKVDGTVSRCVCLVLRCASSGGDCSCGPGVSGDEVLSCEGFEWYCGANDRTSCRGGNGDYGSACANEEHNVSSCAASTIQRANDYLPSCDGLRFAEPAPSGGGGGGGDDDDCSGCSSDSDCHDTCLRCDRSTCSCVRRLSC